MGLQEQVARDLLESMKARETVKTSALRMLKAAFIRREIAGQKPLTDAEALDVLQAEAKSRRESIEQYRKGNRPDLVAQEEAELGFLKPYLPKMLSESDLEALAQDAIRRVGAQGPQDMGKVMSALMPQVKGRADGRQTQETVKKLLS